MDAVGRVAEAATGQGPLGPRLAPPKSAPALVKNGRRMPS